MKMFTLLIAALISTSAFAQVKILDGQYPIGIIAPTNYVKNIGCYQNKADITASAGTFIRNTSSPMNASIGADCKWTPSASAQTITMALKAFDSALKGQNCAAVFPYQGGGTGIKIGVVRNSSVLTEQDLVTPLLGSNVATLNFPCGDLTNPTTIVLTSTIASPAAIQWSAATAGLNTNIFQTEASSVWQEYTPTVSGMTISSSSLKWRRDGADLLIKGSVVVATNAASPGQIFFPSTDMLVAASTSSAPSFAGKIITNMDLGVTYDGQAVMEPGLNYVTLSRRYGTNGDNPLSSSINMNQIYGAGTISFDLRIPISGWTTLSAVAVKDSNFDWTTWAPTSTNGSFGTITPITCVYKRTGPDLEGLCTFSANTVNGSIAQIDLPAGLTTADTSKLAFQPNGANTATVVGKVSRSNAAFPSMVVLAEPNVTYLTFGVGSGATAEMTENGTSAMFNVNEKLSMQFKVPIKGWSENQNAPQLVNSVISDLSGVMKIVGITFVTSTGGGPCTLTSSTSSAVSVSGSTGGKCTIAFNGLYAQAPHCTLSSGDTGVVGAAVANFDNGGAPTTTGFTAQAFSSNTGTLQSVSVSAICVGMK